MPSTPNHPRRYVKPSEAADTTPNHMRLNGDTLVVGAHFGGLLSVAAVTLTGAGHHHPHVTARFSGGLLLELSPNTATELAHKLAESVEAITVLPDVSGAAAHIPETM